MTGRRLNAVSDSASTVRGGGRERNDPSVDGCGRQLARRVDRNEDFFVRRIRLRVDVRSRGRGSHDPSVGRMRARVGTCCRVVSIIHSLERRPEGDLCAPYLKRAPLCTTRQPRLLYICKCERWGSFDAGPVLAPIHQARVCILTRV